MIETRFISAELKWPKIGHNQYSAATVPFQQNEIELMINWAIRVHNKIELFLSKEAESDGEQERAIR